MACVAMIYDHEFSGDIKSLSFNNHTNPSSIHFVRTDKCGEKRNTIAGPFGRTCIFFKKRRN